MNQQKINVQKQTEQQLIVKIVLGLSKKEAIYFLDTKGIEFRIIRTDEINFIVTRDYNPERINLSLDANHVSSVNWG